MAAGDRLCKPGHPCNERARMRLARPDTDGASRIRAGRKYKDGSLGMLSLRACTKEIHNGPSLARSSGSEPRVVACMVKAIHAIAKTGSLPHPQKREGGPRAEELLAKATGTSAMTGLPSRRFFPRRFFPLCPTQSLGLASLQRGARSVGVAGLLYGAQVVVKVGADGADCARAAGVGDDLAFAV